MFYCGLCFTQIQIRLICYTGIIIFIIKKLTTSIKISRSSQLSYVNTKTTQNINCSRNQITYAAISLVLGYCANQPLRSVFQVIFPEQSRGLLHCCWFHSFKVETYCCTHRDKRVHQMWFIIYIAQLIN